MEGYIGEIRMFGGNFAPRHWEYCHGQILQITANTTLFSILGTTYGGDGRTTFALPDLRGRVPLGAGDSPELSNRVLGQKAGNETNKLSLNQLPVQSSGTTTLVTKTRLEVPAATSLKTEQVQAIEPLQVNNMQPWIGIHFIICVEGIYPSRS